MRPKESVPKQARKEEHRPEYDSDEDDQLLTQALNEQETRYIEQDNTTVQNPTPSPPTKKVSSTLTVYSIIRLTLKTSLLIFSSQGQVVDTDPLRGRRRR